MIAVTAVKRQPNLVPISLMALLRLSLERIELPMIQRRGGYLFGRRPAAARR